MKKLAWVILLLALVGIAVGAIQWREAAARAKTKPLVLRDIPYVPDSKDPFQFLDLYLPSGLNKPVPVVVWIHGGAWIAGDKNHPPAEPLLRKGFAVASLNYRLATQARFPAQIHDCKAAIRWLRAHATEFNLDANHIGAWGHSAGGHLAALVATTGDVPSLEGNLGNNDQSSQVQCAVDWAGPADFTTIVKQAPADCRIDWSKPGNPLEVLLGPNPSPEVAWNASPVAHLSAGDPPLLIVHGDADDVVPAAQATEFDEIARKANFGKQQLLLLKDGHSLGGEAVKPTLEFLQKHLQK